MELAVSRIRDGERVGGFYDMVQALVFDPIQLFRVADLGRRRLQRLVESTNE